MNRKSCLQHYFSKKNFFEQPYSTVPIELLPLQGYLRQSFKRLIKLDGRMIFTKNVCPILLDREFYYL